MGRDRCYSCYLSTHNVFRMVLVLLLYNNNCNSSDVANRIAMLNIHLPFCNNLNCKCKTLAFFGTNADVVVIKILYNERC
jgi:hypothetical protein